MLAKLLFLLPIVAFGFGGPNCPSEFSSESCTKKSQCAWCNSTDGNDQLCFNKQSIPKLNKSEWTCSANFQLSTSHLINTPVPSSAYFSVYQQSNAKHCVELLCDSEESYNRYVIVFAFTLFLSVIFQSFRLFLKCLVANLFVLRN